jgi:hypothetical protein
MKSAHIHLRLLAILVVFSWVANATTIYLAGLVAAGIFLCELRLRDRRPAPVRVRAAKKPRH